MGVFVRKPDGITLGITVFVFPRRSRNLSPRSLWRAARNRSSVTWICACRPLNVVTWASFSTSEPALCLRACRTVRYCGSVKMPESVKGADALVSSDELRAGKFGRSISPNRVGCVRIGPEFDEFDFQIDLRLRGVQRLQRGFDDVEVLLGGIDHQVSITVAVEDIFARRRPQVHTEAQEEIDDRSLLRAHAVRGADEIQSVAARTVPVFKTRPADMDLGTTTGPG